MMLVLSAVEWIASDFVIRISYFSMLDNSLPNMKIRPTTIYLLPITSYHLAFGISTLVESALQINHFLTNKANFQKSQMNVNKALTKDYGKMDTWSNGKNKAKTKPIQTQFKANTKPIQTQTNPILARHAVWQGFSAISMAGWRQKMLLRMTINTQPNSFGYYADEIEVPNAYHQADITVTIGVVFSLMFWLCCGFFVYFNWLGLCVCFRTWVPKYACNERYIKSRFSQARSNGPNRPLFRPDAAARLNQLTDNLR